MEGRELHKKSISNEMLKSNDSLLESKKSSLHLEIGFLYGTSVELIFSPK
jgi:hypothetical protein